MRINSIMPCFLGKYNNAASNRKFKLERAVNSFLNQDYDNKKLVIVADGCSETVDFIKHKYSNENSISLYYIDKQPIFSGMVRQYGINKCDNLDIITFLDSDDFYKNSNHLSTIANNFKINDKLNWIYFNDFIKYHHLEHLPLAERDTKLLSGSIGTSQIAYKNLNDISWEGCDGYGHDFKLIEKLINKYPDTNTKISGCSYVTCHIPNSCDC